MKTIVQTGELPNKGLQLTKAARCAPFAFRSWGQSLRAAFAAEARCCTGLRAERRTAEGSWNP